MRAEGGRKICVVPDVAVPNRLAVVRPTALVRPDTYGAERGPDSRSAPGVDSDR